MAKSSILLAHTLQLYVQLLQMREPSPRSKRLASESRIVPHVLHRKQSICHRLPAGRLSLQRSLRVTPIASQHTKFKGLAFFQYLPHTCQCCNLARSGHSTRAVICKNRRTSPQPLHGYTASSGSIGDSGYAAEASMTGIVLFSVGRPVVSAGTPSNSGKAERRQGRLPMGCMSLRARYSWEKH